MSDRAARAVCLLILMLSPVAAAADPPADAEAVTAADPAVAVEVLELRLRPLRVEQLEVEMEAWVELLQAKVAEVTEAQVEQRGAEGEARAELARRVARLQLERGALAERADAVRNALDLKGGDVERYDAYIDAVSGFDLEVTDVGSLWATVETWLASPEGGLRWAKNIFFFLLTLVAFWILGRIVGRLVARGVQRVRGASDLLRRFLVTLAKGGVLILGVVVALSMLEVNVGPFIAVFGVAGFVIGFAMQDSLSNFAAGVMILFYRPFDVGDAVEAGGVSGTVRAMTLVSTTIHTWDNMLLIVPNSKIWGDVITNISGNATRRVDMVFGIGYGDDLDRARDVLESIVTGHEKVLDDPPPTIRVHELADSSVNFVVRPWTNKADYWDVYWDVTRAVKKRFDEAGISIPFPQRDVHVYGERGGDG